LQTIHILTSFLLTVLRYISLPLALLYGIIVALRNKFYDWGIFSSISFSLPVICVGNITVGGTGKSPHIEYLIELIQHRYRVATLSRGYKRYTRGFKIADEKSNARDIGDEPFQFKFKYPQIEVCVAEERMTAIPQLLQRKPDIDVILLDDAFQHRTVRAGLSIVLTDFRRLYTRDHIMPFGLLRESRKAADRADIIIITKCPLNLSQPEKEKLVHEIHPTQSQHVFFTGIRYTKLYPLTGFEVPYTSSTSVLLVCGIANPEPLITHCQTIFKQVHTLTYKDHHYFTFDDLDEIKETFTNIKSEHKIIITTEKDAARVMLLKDAIITHNLPIYVQAIGIQFLFEQEIVFDTIISSFIEQYLPPEITADDSETTISNSDRSEDV
jgi:tetraacyldisaccharide 4'-kinase